MTPARSMNGAHAPKMRGGFAFSVGVHAVILALLIFGLPYFHRKALDVPPTISVELVDTGKETTTNKVSDANKVEKQPEETKPAPPTPPPPQAQQTPPQPQPQPQPQPKPTFEEAPKLAAVEDSVPDLKAPTLDISKPLPEAPKLADVDTKVSELTVPKVDLKKVEPKPPAESFDAVLKNLTKQTPQPPTDQPPNPRVKTPPRPATGAQAPLAANLTASEMDALKNQLRQCWSLPATAKDAQDLVVDIDISVNPDRTLASAQVVDQGRMASDPAFRAAAMSAVRAFRMPQCTPLELPPDKYQEWQSMTVRFDPKEMLGQ